MAQKKENSGGNKFKKRLPAEKRVRVSNKKEDKPFREKPDRRSKGADGPYNRGESKPFKKREFPGEKRSGTGYKKDAKSYGPPSDKRGSKPGWENKSGTDKPYKKREYSGQKRETSGYKKDSGTYSKGPASRGKKTGWDGRGADEKPFRKTGYSSDRNARGTEKKFGTRKPADRAESTSRSKFGDRKPQGRNTSFGEKKAWKPKEFGAKTDRKTGRADTGRTAGGRGFQRPQNFKGGRKNYDKNADNLETGKSLVEEDVRLNRYIANSGMCSRREADVMIAQGLVSINGVVVETLGTKVKIGDDVRVDGKRINPEKPVYILLNKPKGYITSTSDPDERATVMDLIDLPGKERIYPVGRLDRNTTGVLLLTNDGELAQKLMHPSFEIKKVYKAGLDRKPSKDHLLAWVQGVELEDGFMSFEQIGFVDEDDNTTLGLEVHSGRNRIVRRMFEHFEYEVKSLDRVLLGEFDHLKLGRGKWRFLNDKEIRYVEKLKRMKGKKRGS